MDERATELIKIGIFAPIGLATLCAEKVIPVLRDEAQNLRQQVPAARFIGKMATDQINLQLRTRCANGGDQLQNLSELARSVLAKLTGPQTPTQQGSGTNLSTSSPLAEPASRTPMSHGTGLDAIEGYESLSAPQVLTLLDGLTDVELAEVEAFEVAHRQRRTILNRIAQLRNS
jgi:hypothetical protein